MNQNYVSECLNGELRVGDEVLHLPIDDHPIMRGVVKAIYPAGSEEAQAATDNVGDCILVCYDTEGYSDKRVAELEAHFSGLYGQPRTLDDIGLDEVADSQDCLLNISALPTSAKELYDRDEASAISAAFDFMSQLLAPELLEKLNQQLESQKL